MDKDNLIITTPIGRVRKLIPLKQYHNKILSGGNYMGKVKALKVNLAGQMSTTSEIEFKGWILSCDLWIHYRIKWCLMYLCDQTVCINNEKIVSLEGSKSG